MSNEKENLDKKKAIILKYNLTSDFYENRYLNIQKNKYSLLLQDFILNEKIILDAGCGTGRLFDTLEKIHPLKKMSTYFFVGIDISIKMLNKFKDRLKKLKNSRVTLILCDLENLPLRNSTFNLIFSVTSLQNLPDIFKGIKEVIRVGMDFAYIKLSILKKKMDKGVILNFVNQFLNKINIINDKSIEDIIIEGIKNDN